MLVSIIFPYASRFMCYMFEFNLPNIAIYFYNYIFLIKKMHIFLYIFWINIKIRQTEMPAGPVGWFWLTASFSDCRVHSEHAQDGCCHCHYHLQNYRNVVFVLCSHCLFCFCKFFNPNRSSDRILLYQFCALMLSVCLFVSIGVFLSDFSWHSPLCLLKI